MIDQRLGSGEPLVIPVDNVTTLSTSGQSTQFTGQWTIATQSLDAILATMRLTSYQTQDTVIPALTAGDASYFGAPAGRQVPAYQFICNDNAPAPTAVPALGGAASGMTYPGVPGSATYSIGVDSRIVPQFLPDSHACLILTQNAFDKGALARGTESAYGNIDEWKNNAFCMGVSFKYK